MPEPSAIPAPESAKKHGDPLESALEEDNVPSVDDNKVVDSQPAQD